MSDLIHTEEYKWYAIEICQDEDSESPREWDNLGKMVCFHKRYTLGDKHFLSRDGFKDWDEFGEWLEKEVGAAVILPLYLYDHGGITMNTGGFSCQWDSGQVGFIYATKEDILKEFGGKRLTKALKEKVEGILQGEVKVYDDFIKGNVYGFKILKDGEEIDSCWGFIGYYDEKDCALATAKSNIDASLAFTAKREAEVAQAAAAIDQVIVVERPALE